MLSLTNGRIYLMQLKKKNVELAIVIAKNGHNKADWGPRISDAGIKCDDLFKKDNKKLCFYDDDEKYLFILAKSEDVPKIVDSGIADIGFVGKNIIIESTYKLKILKELNYDKCNLSIIVNKNSEINENDIHSVTTKYSVFVSEYFKNKDQNVEIFKLDGACEIGAVLGITDAVVDTVYTGEALIENDLKILKNIGSTQAVIIASPSAYSTKRIAIDDFIKKIRE